MVKLHVFLTVQKCKLLPIRFLQYYFGELVKLIFLPCRSLVPLGYTEDGTLVVMCRASMFL